MFGLRLSVCCRRTKDVVIGCFGLAPDPAPAKPSPVQKVLKFGPSSLYRFWASLFFTYGLVLFVSLVNDEYEGKRPHSYVVPLVVVFVLTNMGSNSWRSMGRFTAEAPTFTTKMYPKSSYSLLLP